MNLYREKEDSEVQEERRPWTQIDSNESSSYASDREGQPLANKKQMRRRRNIDDTASEEDGRKSKRRCVRLNRGAVLGENSNCPSSTGLPVKVGTRGS